MRREFLENLDLGNGAKLSQENIESIMAEYGKVKNAQDNQIQALTTERDGLKAQLEEAGREIQSYKDMDIEGIKAKAGEWESKYHNDTKALKEQLESANYGFAVKEAVSGLKFTSESAKKAFVSDLTAKKLPLQDGKLLGLEDFAKEYRASDPGAFVPENVEKTPVWSRGTSESTEVTPLSSLRSAMGLENKQ